MFWGIFRDKRPPFRGKAPNIFYYASDSGEWEDTQLGYSRFLYWALCGDTSKFYELYRWDGWCDDVSNFSNLMQIYIKPLRLDSLYG